MRDIAEIRVWRVSVILCAGWPVVRTGYNPNQHLIKTFGWLWLWWRGKRWPWERS